MALHFDLMVNGRPIGRTVVVQRTESLDDGHAWAGLAAPVYGYVVSVVDENAVEGPKIPFKHDYDDGALWCARRALDALLGEETGW